MPSIEDDLIQDSRDILMEHERCIPVLGRPVTINDYQILSREVVRERSCRLNYERSAADNEAISVVYQSCRLYPCRLRQSLTVESDVGSYHAAALRAARDRSFSLEYEIGRILLMALLTVIAQGRAVNFLDITASRSLMKAVYVLGNNTVEFACLLHLSELIVCPVRFDPMGIEFLSVKLIEDFRTVFKAVDAQKVFGAVSVKLDVMLVIKAVLGPEVRDAALRGYPRASEENDVLALFYDLIQSRVII